MTSNILDFLSRYCKTNNHNECVSKWYGLGLEAHCYCSCHNKKRKALDLVEGPLANAIDRTDAVIITQTGDHNGDN